MRVVHRVEQGDAARHVVAVVDRGLDHGFTDERPRAAVEDGFDRIVAKQVRDQVAITE